MRNENNNGVIDFDESSFLSNNTETKTDVKTNPEIDASTLNVDDIFGTWSNDEVSTQDKVTPVSNDYNNSNIESTDSDTSLEDSNSLDIFGSNLESSNSLNTNSNLDNSKEESNFQENSNLKESKGEVNPIEVNKPIENTNLEIEKKEDTPSFDANAGSFVEPLTMNVINPETNIVNDNQENSNIGSNLENNSIISDNSLNSNSNESNPGENNTLEINHDNMETSSLQEALSTPISNNSIELNNPIDSNDSKDQANTGENNISQNSNTLGNNNNLETNSNQDNNITLDNSVSIGTVNPVENNNTSDNTSKKENSKKKVNLPVIVLILIIVISIGVIIIKRDVLIDFFNTLINK